jgi:uncharacterized protein (UPF0332 family)
MDSEAKIYLDRAGNEILLSENDMRMSIDDETKKFLGIPMEKTFFNSVISHAYYAIFYAAKAYLKSLDVKTSPPEEHKKTYEEFKKIVDSGNLDKQLLEIYETESIKAEVLLYILLREKKKRGLFTYNIKSEANIPYAKESIDNSVKFLSLIKLILEKS